MKTAPTPPPGMASEARAPTHLCGSVVRALLKKNSILKLRHGFATLAELLSPLVCILLFALLKSLDPDLEIPAGWASTYANRTGSSSVTTGSHWVFSSQVDLLNELIASVAGVGLPGVSDVTNLVSSTTPTPSLSASATLGQKATTTQSTGLSSMSTAAILAQLRIPRFFFHETTMPGLLINLAIQSLTEADRLNELSPRDLTLCVAKFALLGFTSLDPTSLYYIPTECQGKVVPYKLAIAPDTLYTRQYMTSVLDQWYPRLPLLEPILGVSPLYSPAFSDSRLLFANESALESYITTEAYGADVFHPKIYAALTFQEFPLDLAEIGDITGHDMAFTIRMNATSSRSGVPASVPRTMAGGLQINKFMDAVQSQNTMTYATRGFLTLQTAVMRVLNCMPPWDQVNGRVLDADVCQLTQSTMIDTSQETDDRLLRQVEDDLVISSLLRLTGEALKRVTVPTSVSGFGNFSTAMDQAIKQLSEPKISVAKIPDGSRRALLRVLRQAPQAFHGASVFMSPTDSFTYGSFYDEVSVAFPILFLLSYLYGVSRVIVALLVEKETRSREFMKILGIHDHQIIVSWLMTYLQIFTVGSLLQTFAGYLLLFRNSNAMLLFAFFFTFALSTFGFAFLVSAFFDRARAGSFAGMGLFFMTFFASFSFSESSSEVARTFGCLLSPVALSQGVNILAVLEAVGVGLTFANAGDNVRGFRFQSAIYMQLFDFFLYMAIGWYCEKILPKEHGVTEHWFFPFSRAFWRRYLRQEERRQPKDASPATDEIAVAMIEDHCPDTNEEPVSAELKKQEQRDRAIVISRLRKVFDVPGGTKVAVHGLNLSLYEGQILCLLGHNGAGKTTLISMLTGDARIRGVSILNGMSVIRQSLGYCPQYSVVYPELTVEEHLTFYAQAKQTQGHTVDRAKEVDGMICEVGLVDKRNVQAHALSGGMKRKLSLAIAFQGNNRVVFLDEPTSGMDPYSRRSTWELIQRNKHGRIVILTTHFMDEADLLGDRIAIMAEGELRCVGSSLFLKQHYGVGYRLSFVVEAATATTRELCELIQGSIAEARLATDIGSEVTFQLPFQSSAKFPALFDAIDARKTELGILSYAISVTTLEDIFLKVAETSCVRPPTIDLSCKLDMSPMISTSGAKAETNTWEPHGRLMWFLIQLHALLLKRFLSAKRDRSMLFFGTALPVAILFVGLSALQQSQWDTNDPSVALTTADQYELGGLTPLPIACIEAGGNHNSEPDPWCESTMAFFPESIPSRVHVDPIVFDGSVEPTVFNLSYQSQPIEPTDTTGYCLRFAQLAFERGYAKDADSMAPLPNRQPVSGQYGGLMLQATARDQVLAYSIMANSSSYHSAPTYKTMVDQAIHNFLLANGSATAPFRKIHVSTHPFPLPLNTRSIVSAAVSLQAVLFVLIAFMFLPAAMMPFLVKEKQYESNAHHQQLLSGVSLLAYWLANLLFDLLMYTVPMITGILLLQFYNFLPSLDASQASAQPDAAQAVAALFALFGTAIVPWTYATSHFMRDAESCLLYTVMLNVLVGLVFQLVSVALELFESTRPANLVLVFLWRCSPLFCLSNGLLRVVMGDIGALYGLRSEPLIAFSKDVAGYEMVYLAAQGPLFFVITLAVDYYKTGVFTVCGLNGGLVLKSVWGQLRSQWLGAKYKRVEAKPPMNDLLVDDEDVRTERARVLKDDGDLKDVMQITELSKTYPNGKRALTNLTFGLQRGDCFGFLGINGAGKTTTMKILTGDLLPSTGSATLNGFDILKQNARVRQNIGYCPQFDALLELLTVREHLELFGRLKGFTGKQLERQVRQLLTQFQLGVFEQKLASRLSGGNKRKLSVAIAMLGEPALLFLDEPSTGMDPFSRRFMWDIILRVSVQTRKSTVMLTTHVMEECEALCNRAGIMVDGKLQCFGTVPHLKDRFGDGFLLECKLETASKGAIDSVVRNLEAQGLVQRGEGNVHIERSQLPAVGDALGSPYRVECVLEGNSSSPVDHSTGSLDAHEFVSWWLLEDRVDALTAFLQTNFGAYGGVVVVERQVDFCRFKLTPLKPTTSINEASETEVVTRPFALARTFRLIEGARMGLGVKEYSISQTSLDQIFNRFAQHLNHETESGGNAQ